MNTRSSPLLRTFETVVISSFIVGSVSCIAVAVTILRNIEIIASNHFKFELAFKKQSQLNAHLFVNQHMGAFIGAVSLSLTLFLIASAAINQLRDD